MLKWLEKEGLTQLAVLAQEPGESVFDLLLIDSLLTFCIVPESQGIDAVLNVLLSVVFDK